MTPPTTTDDVLRLARELLAASEEATPGPWLYRPHEYDDWGWVRRAPDGQDGPGLLVATARSGGYPTDPDLDEHRRNGTDPYGHNALFIALARDHAPALARRVEADARVIEAARPFLDMAFRSDSRGVAAVRALHDALRDRDEALAKGESAALDTERSE